MTITLLQQRSALRGHLTKFVLRYNEPFFNVDNFLGECKAPIISKLNTAIERHGGIKYQIQLTVKFKHAVDENKTIEAHFANKQSALLAATNREESLNNVSADISQRVANFESRGSGWVIERVVGGNLHIAVFQPLRASSYIPLPKQLRYKRCIVNVKNEDDKCFLWALLSAVHKQDVHPERISHYKKHQNSVDMAGIDFPVPVDRIPQIADANNMSISVYEFDNHLRPLLLPANGLKEKHIDLLYLRSGGRSHYCWIKNLDGLLFDQNKHKNGKYYCRKCLRRFYNDVKRTNHEAYCSKGLQTISMPAKETMSFQRYDLMLRKPFVIYSDFECLLQGVDGCSPNPTSAYQQPTHYHQPCGYACATVLQCCDQTAKLFPKARVYRGEGCVKDYLDTVVKYADDYVTNFHQIHRDLVMSSTEQRDHDVAEHCHVCRKSLEGDAVRDHCHVCGRYRGAAHSKCNLSQQLAVEIPVVFHNLRRYDGHLIMQQIGKLANDNGLTLSCIPKSMEDYLTFSIQKKIGNRTLWKLKFIDSFQFMSASLDTLVRNLASAGSNAFSGMGRQFCDEGQLKLLLKKGIYPYEYMTSWERFQEKSLPPIEKFYSSLSGNGISSEDYGHAQNVWKTFSIKTMGEYHDLYVLTDTLLLLDVFENFRTFVLANYRVDPCNFVSLPSLSWQACLLMTGVELDLLQDESMYQFFEEGIRGGVAMISHRHAKANNELLPEFDPSEPSSYILYLDANNLYGTSMIQPLPVSNFEWMTPGELSDFKIEGIDGDGDIGYVLDVDMEYPEALHDTHNCYPLAPEKVSISFNELSPLSQRVHEELHVFGAENEKLIPTLRDRHNYVVHYRNLQLYLRLGMKIKSINRGIKFQQARWMAPYINFNTEKRKGATNSFEKDLFKLLNNSIFGKSCENVRNHRQMELVTRHERFVKLSAKENFHQCEIFSDDLVGVEMVKLNVVLDKPVYTGFTILELAKYTMYHFHYNVFPSIMNTCRGSAKLLFTDTDSLCYYIECENLYRSLGQHIDHFDFSEYPLDHRLYNTKNKKVMGKMKDETSGKPVLEFVGLKAKMYSLIVWEGEDASNKKTAKGVTRKVISLLCHRDYLDILEKGTIRRDSMQSIRSEAHIIRTVEMNKISLSVFDNKRYINDDGVSTRAYGHYSIGA